MVLFFFTNKQKPVEERVAAEEKKAAAETAAASADVQPQLATEDAAPAGDDKEKTFKRFHVVPTVIESQTPEQRF